MIRIICKKIVITDYFCNRLALVNNMGHLKKMLYALLRMRPQIYINLQKNCSRPSFLQWTGGSAYLKKEKKVVVSNHPWYIRPAHLDDPEQTFVRGCLFCKMLDKVLALLTVLKKRYDPPE